MAYFGHSILIDPRGEIMAEGQKEEASVIADLDLDMAAAAREKMTVFPDRMPAVYRTFGELSGGDVLERVPFACRREYQANTAI